MAEYIVRDGDTGRALVSSTGTPVDEILQALEDGGHFQSALARHPEITPEGVVAALRYARIAVSRGGRPTPRPHEGFQGVREAPLQAFNGGASAGVVTLEAAEYDDLLYRLDLFEGIFDAERDLDAGHGIPSEQVFADLRHKFGG